MISGALNFQPLINRYLGHAANLAVSSPFLYGVHEASQKTVDEIAGHLSAVDALIAEGRETSGGSYFGVDLTATVSRLDDSEVGAHFNQATIVAAFRTPEIAIEPEALARLVRQRVRQDPKIEVRTLSVVTGVENGASGLVVSTRGPDGTAGERFEHVVNALWDGRLAIDATFGLKPGRRWIHRLKYGLRFRLNGGRSLPTTTIVLGPYGDTVAYGDGSFYLSWYPAGMIDHSQELSPPQWPGTPDEAVQPRMASESLAGLANLIPALAVLAAEDFHDLRIKGGTIVAWGETDIDDRQSVLHIRRDIGVISTGRYHSVDTGKLTMAPYFASLCAERIANG
jgi:hypothetical protein